MLSALYRKKTEQTNQERKMKSTQYELNCDLAKMLKGGV